MRWAAVMVLAAACVVPAGNSAAALSTAQRSVVLEEAQAAYERGINTLPADPSAARESFQQAAARFQQLVDDGLVNGNLCYDLGNAWLQAGDLGRAILNYRQAERLIPGDPRLEHNLGYARSLRRNHIPASGERALGRALLGWHHGTSLRARATVAGAAYGLFWVLLGLLRFRASTAARWLAAGCAVIWIGAGTSVGADVLIDTSGREGVILDENVVVRKGNGEGFEPRFQEPLHPGVEFRVLDHRDGWIQIELPDAKTGWIAEASAGLIGTARPE